MSTYGETVSRFARWAIGQRIVHDIIIHPLMAITSYSDWALKLHDYHSFATMKPVKHGVIGIMGRVEDVEAAFDGLGMSIQHMHTDGAVCCGISRERPRRGIPVCGTCAGRGGWYAPRLSDDFGPARWVRCPKCHGERT